MNKRTVELDAMLRTAGSSGALLWVVPKAELRAPGEGESHRALVELLKYARNNDRLRELEGRVVLNFQGFDADPRPIPAIEECREWLNAVSDDATFLFYVLEPRTALPLLMLCHVPFRTIGGTVLPDQDGAVGFLLDCAASAYQLARLDDWPKPKAVAADFLARAGLGSIVNDDLLDDFERTFENDQA